MNAVTPIEPEQSAITCAGLSGDFNTLCGQLTRLYARIEIDMVRTIQWLEPEGKVPPMLSQRAARLHLLIKGRSEPLVKSIAKSLGELQPHLDRRNILVHGNGTIATRSTGWLWPWEVRTGPKAVAERGFWTDQEMRDFQKDLKSKSDRLHSYVDRLCKTQPS